MGKKTDAIVKQDTSTTIARDTNGVGKITPWGAIATITDSISNVINVWNRERNITERVRLECIAAIQIAKLSVDKMRIQKDAYEKFLQDKKEDRIVLKENLDKFWKQVEIWDNKFKNLDLEEMKKHEDLLSKYMEFKKAILTQIVNLFSHYYQRNINSNLMIENK
jgi:hypothetical protein